MAGARRSRRAWRQIWRYWGLILVVVMVVSLDRHLGVLPYAVMTMLVVIWSLFAAPTWCGAVNRRRGREIQYCDISPLAPLGRPANLLRLPLDPGAPVRLHANLADAHSCARAPQHVARPRCLGLPLPPSARHAGLRAGP
jgi:hypothetical protein